MGGVHFSLKSKKNEPKRNLFKRFATAALSEPSQPFYKYSQYNSSKYLEFGSSLPIPART